MTNSFSRLWFLLQDISRTRNQPALQSNFIHVPSVLAKTTIAITDPFQVKINYQLTDDDIINLAGGFPTNNFIEAKFAAESTDKTVIKTLLLLLLEIKSNGDPILAQVERTIDFKEKMIHNDIMYCGRKGGGMGTNLFINQLLAMMKHSFHLIEVLAAGPDMGVPEPGSTWDGFKTWVKYGYKMKETSQLNYDTWHQHRNYREDTLNKLYWWETNYCDWEVNGFSWDGIFELKKSRNSLLLFKIYLWKKKINVSEFGFHYSEALSLIRLLNDLYKHK